MDQSLKRSCAPGWRGPASAVQGAHYRQVFGPSPPCFHLRGYFQNENDACRLFYPRSKKRQLCQNQQRVSEPSRFPKTQRLTQSCDSWSGSSKPGTPYLLSYLGCGNKRWGGAGACWWKSRGKVKYYDSFHFLGRGLENSHPFLRPSLLANGAVLV